MNRLGVDEEFLSIRHADLVENVRQMMTDRTVGDREGVSNVLIRKTLAEQLDDLSFSGCEAIRPGRVFLFDRGSQSESLSQTRDAHDILCAVGVVRNRGVERVNQGQHNFRRLNLQQHAVHAAVEGFVHTVLIFKSAQQEDFARRSRFPDPSERSHAVSFSLHIQDENVRVDLREAQIWCDALVLLNDEAASRATLKNFLQSQPREVVTANNGNGQW